jgi:antitoxin component YwqK of YwqJK toxin-antitoxin module
METKKITKIFPWGGKAEYEVNELGQYYGLYQSWRSDGSKRERCTFENDKFHGLYRYWAPDKTTSSLGTFKKDILFGTMIQFEYE